MLNVLLKVDFARMISRFFSTSAEIGSTWWNFFDFGESLSIEERYETKMLLLWATASFDGQLLYVLYVGTLLSLNLSILGV